MLPLASNRPACKMPTCVARAWMSLRIWLENRMVCPVARCRWFRHVQKIGPHQRIQARGRLVEDQQRRLVGHRDHQGQLDHGSLGQVL